MNKPATVPEQFDAVVVGAGFSGLYMLYRLRQLGLSVQGLRRRPTTSAGRGTGTAIPGPAATSPPRTTPTASTRSWRRSGPGRRSTPRSRRSWTTCGSWPTATSCARTSSSRPPSPRPAGTSRRGGGRSRPMAATRSACRYYIMASGCLSMPKSPDIEGADRFAGPGLLHQPLAARGRRLHRPAGRGHRHRLVGHPVHPADRPPGQPAHGLPAHPELLHPGAQRPRPGRAAAAAGRRTATRTGTPPGGRAGGMPVEPTDVLGAHRQRGGPPGAVRGGLGSRASCSASSASSPTRA